MSRERLERETGIEPATNGLGSRYSTIELLPLRFRLYSANLIERDLPRAFCRHATAALESQLRHRSP